MSKTLNILKDLDEVRIAFDLMEGWDIAYGSGPYSLDKALIEFKKYLDYKKENPNLDIDTIATIYGLGGIHRYFLNSDGTIRFSKFHMGWKDISKDAESLGFIL